MFTLRPYQEEAIEALVASMQQDRFVLLQAATGAGKTIIFSELIKRLLKEYRMRICVLVHRREIVQQNADKLRQVWPDAPIGIACATSGEDVNVDAPVVIGSIQTLSNRLNATSPFHLIIVDEAHRLPPRNHPSQYGKFIGRMESYFPDLRVIGITATPYRLGMGNIYGDAVKHGVLPWFGALHSRIGIRELQALGYLCGIRAKEAENIERDLTAVAKSGGDFNLGELSYMMSKEIHINSAVRAYQEYGEGREFVVVFCVTIDHAEKVRDAFSGAGFATGCVHSKMSLEDRDRTLSAYEAGSIQILVNVGVLQEGWDSPKTDCLLLCRPTMSPALYVQQIGRALRIYPGKETMLILDLSGNIARHGDPDSPKVVVPTSNGKKVELESAISVKKCPSCKELVPIRVMECPECGYLWLVEALPTRMLEIDFQAPKIRSMNVLEFRPSYFISKAGNRMLKVVIYAIDSIKTQIIPSKIYHFLDIEGNASSYGKTKARMFWQQFGEDMPPETIQESVERWDELNLPDMIHVAEDGKYLRWVI